MFFLICNELHAVDIYTGLPLWQVSLPSSAKFRQFRQEHFVARRSTAENYMATSDILYVQLGNSCLMLDAATGSRMGEIDTPAALKNVQEENLQWHEARIWKYHLLVSMGPYLACMDRRTGDLEWKIKADRDRFSFAAANEKVFSADYWMTKRRRRGENVADARQPRRPAGEAGGHVGAETARDLHQQRGLGVAPQPRQRPERRGGVGGTAAEARGQRDALGQPHRHRRAAVEGGGEAVDGGGDEAFARRPQRRRERPVDGEIERGGRGEREIVAEGGEGDDAVEQVVAVGTPALDVEVEVELRRRRLGDGRRRHVRQPASRFGSPASSLASISGTSSGAGSRVSARSH